MDRPLANDEHTSSGDRPKREHPTAAALMTSSVSRDQSVPSKNQLGHSDIPSTSTFMARHALQPTNSTQADSPPPVLPILALSNVPPTTSSSTIGEKDVADVEEEARPRPFTGPSLPADIEPQRSVTLDLRRPRSGIDWIVPVDEKTFRQKAIGERLDPTLITAISERDKCALNAKMAGYALNAAIGLQVILGSLTTGLAAVTSGRQVLFISFFPSFL